MKESRLLNTQDGLTDEALSFGDMTMIRGKGFPEGEPESDSAVPIAKQWIEVKQRRFVLEEILLSRVSEQLNALPKRTAALKPQGEDPVLRRVSKERLADHVRDNQRL